MSAEARLLLRQVRSENGRPWQQRLVLKGLGLRGCGTENTVPNERAIRGMIRKVLHLIEVSSVEASQAGGASKASKAKKPAASAAKGSKS